MIDDIYNCMVTPSQQLQAEKKAIQKIIEKKGITPQLERALGVISGKISDAKPTSITQTVTQPLQAPPKTLLDTKPRIMQTVYGDSRSVSQVQTGGIPVRTPTPQEKLLAVQPSKLEQLIEAGKRAREQLKFVEQPKPKEKLISLGVTEAPRLKLQVTQEGKITTAGIGAIKPSQFIREKIGAKVSRQEEWLSVGKSYDKIKSDISQSQKEMQELKKMPSDQRLYVEDPAKQISYEVGKQEAIKIKEGEIAKMKESLKATGEYRNILTTAPLLFLQPELAKKPLFEQVPLFEQAIKEEAKKPESYLGAGFMKGVPVVTPLIEQIGAKIEGIPTSVTRERQREEYARSKLFAIPEMSKKGFRIEQATQIGMMGVMSLPLTRLVSAPIRLAGFGAVATYGGYETVKGYEQLKKALTSQERIEARTRLGTGAFMGIAGGFGVRGAYKEIQLSRPISVKGITDITTLEKLPKETRAFGESYLYSKVGKYEVKTKVPSALISREGAKGMQETLGIGGTIPKRIAYTEITKDIFGGEAKRVVKLDYGSIGISKEFATVTQKGIGEVLRSEYITEARVIARPKEVPKIVSEIRGIGVSELYAIGEKRISPTWTEPLRFRKDVSKLYQIGKEKPLPKTLKIESEIGVLLRDLPVFKPRDSYFKLKARRKYIGKAPSEVGKKFVPYSPEVFDKFGELFKPKLVPELAKVHKVPSAIPTGDISSGGRVLQQMIKQDTMRLTKREVKPVRQEAFAGASESALRMQTAGVEFARVMQMQRITPTIAFAPTTRQQPKQMQELRLDQLTRIKPVQIYPSKISTQNIKQILSVTPAVTQRVTPIQRISPIDKIVATPITPITPVGITGFPPLIPTIFPPMLYGQPSGRRSRYRLPKPRKQYKPSLTAIAFGIRTTRPIRELTERRYTGLEVRPMPIEKNFRKLNIF